MSSENKFGLLRSILHALGLSADAVDDIIDRILDLLSEREPKQTELGKIPYALRDDFLSPAEQSFFLVLKSAIGERLLICPKVSLGDLFFVTLQDPSERRSFGNKIDRKHVDFLICDPTTVRPVGGVELDDSSHQRSDRQVRDEFVNQVFAAARVPLVRVPARRAYTMGDVAVILAQLGEGGYGSKVTSMESTPRSATTASSSTPPATAVSRASEESAPSCPKCGGVMVLRTAKNGANQGNQFWGCSNFPRCRYITPHQ